MTQAFNLSQLANFVNSSGQLDASTALYNQTPVSNGGTGKSSVTAGALLIGNGTSAMNEVSGTGANQLLASSPTGWASVPSASVAGGDYNAIYYVGTSPGTYTVPSTLKAVRVTVIGGGGSGSTRGSAAPTQQGGGAGGAGGGGIKLSISRATLLGSYPTGIIPIAAGAAGISPSPPGNAPGTTGGTSSFGAFCSATGGGGGGAIGTTSPGGAAGTTAGTDISVYSSPAYFGSRSGGATTGSAAIGSGGNFGVWSLFSGQGGVGVSATPGTSNPGVGYGSGGGGMWCPTSIITKGGNGSAGLLLIEEFY